MATDPGGQWRIALEAQLSPITREEIQARAARMLQDKVRSVWSSDRPRPPWLGTVPSVRLEPADGGGLDVAEGRARFTAGRWDAGPRAPLAHFLHRVFAGRIVPHPRQRPTAYPLQELDTVFTAPHYVRQARAHSKAGEAEAAYRAIDAAFAACDRAGPAAHDLPSMYWMTHGECHEVAASCALTLGEPARALEHFDAALRHGDPYDTTTEARGAGIYLARQAEAHLALGDMDAAVDVAERASNNSAEPTPPAAPVPWPTCADSSPLTARPAPSPTSSTPPHRSRPSATHSCPTVCPPGASVRCSGLCHGAARCRGSGPVRGSRGA
ncbi:hypothetical protein GCM10018787_49560 [Streptomyces thermodiastaticus]|jgi:tetratricopeptide (TPR) repeat protein|uniref:tetratricopeptide repeat protein n=1 Tax=Streptomyces thermodiastaticus TaxID=44061 RepID=UPI00167C2BDB|nr:hypothetical protein [Streptomyces thermodiastaticus]MCE7553266.1 hypothetical protein [Streptomyces thermodiastaticus]GHF94869.1 hypothetical protein GCM10018787_49560 [Streptomyces thermodiastaticus]